MNDHPFLRFINLVNFDQKLQLLENQKINIKNEISLVKKQEEDFLYGIKDLKNRILQLKKQVDEEELEMKILDQKEKDKKKHLENLTDYKDYRAIKAEIETIHIMQLQQEKNVLNAWSQLENAQAQIGNTSSHDQSMSELHEKMKLLDQKHAEIDSEIKEKALQREALEKDIPAEWLQKYIIMRARVSDPVVTIMHQSCGACSHMITAQDMARANRGALVQCQNCYRLLYVPEMMQRIQ